MGEITSDDQKCTAIQGGSSWVKDAVGQCCYAGSQGSIIGSLRSIRTQAGNFLTPQTFEGQTELSSVGGLLNTEW